VKTTPQGGAAGFDSGKKVRGRKRHLWVDSLGLLVAVVVTAADVHDSRAACDLFYRRLCDDLPRRRVVYTDSQYTAGYLDAEVFDYSPFERVVVSRPPGAEGFVRLPQRSVVERTIAWLGRSRRLSKDYERKTESSEAMILASMTHLMLRRSATVERSYAERFCYAAQRTSCRITDFSHRLLEALTKPRPRGRHRGARCGNR
jgi:putative transposase